MVGRVGDGGMDDGAGSSSSIMEGEKKLKQKQEGDLRLNTGGAMETLMKYHPDQIKP